MRHRRALSIPLMGDLLRDIRAVMDDLLANLPKDLRDATNMVAIELVNNAAKYGISVPAAPSATVDLCLGPHTIEVQVKNGAVSAEAVQEVEGRIAKMSSPARCEELYMERLQQMLDDPKETGRLGLFRIGFEGQFHLTSTYQDQVLTVTATRELA